MSCSVLHRRSLVRLPTRPDAESPESIPRAPLVVFLDFILLCFLFFYWPDISFLSCVLFLFFVYYGVFSSDLATLGGYHGVTGWHEPSDSLASIVSPNRFLLEPPLHDGHAL